MASYTPDPISTPPVPPPKPNSHDASGISTPITSGYPPSTTTIEGRQLPSAVAPPSNQIPDPGDQWLPQILQDKSKDELAEILASPALLNSLVQSHETIHPSLKESHAALQTALRENIDLAAHIADLSTRLSHQRAQTQAQLLSTHTLERQWRSRQSDMDHALGPFAPASLYQRLGQGVGEQEGVVRAMEESFLETEGEDGERDMADWVRRYREERKGFWLRAERKERWDEGRVGGWR